jgi:hypothetical protein
MGQQRMDSSSAVAHQSRHLLATPRVLAPALVLAMAGHSAHVLVAHGPA